MVNMTLAIPEEMRREMKRHPDVRWSQVARDAIKEKLGRLQSWEQVEKIVQKSKLTEKDAEEIGNRIKKAAAKRLGLR
ncbi:hypothetical protein J4475_01650 [Candidatus Woesearchaeota archaeon]|nr:hypothetical protein [Candidatus Woesearchaeota archaeon]